MQYNIAKRQSCVNIITDMENMNNLHLCNTYREMLMALSDVIANDQSATIVYLQDYLPIGETAQRELRDICKEVDFIYTSDANELQAFQQLPRWVPSILSRNIRFNRFGMPLQPHNWRPSYLVNRRFKTGYIYHSGFFMSKVIAGISNEIVLREDGYTNYTPHRVPSHLKRVLRWLRGLPPSVQVFGEERWITKLEMSTPERLPLSVRNKAQKLLFNDLMNAIPAAVAHRLAATFAPSLTSVNGTAAPKTALLLTQPIEIVGMCSIAQKNKLYQDIVDWLVTKDYTVFVKNHPREPVFELRRTVTIPGSFPIEAWPFLSSRTFDVGIALCTSALMDNKMTFVKRGAQLITPDTFFAHATDTWCSQIEMNLKLLS